MSSPTTPSARPPLVLGLAGGIGAGKSSVAKALVEHGFDWIDADRIAKEILHSPALRPALLADFGQGIFDADGAIDRDRLANRVFADAAARRRLEEHVHPRVRERIHARLAEAAQAGAPVLLDVPLLFEGGLVDLCDAVLFVDCPADVRRARAVARGMRADDWARREEQQLDVAEKRRRSQHVIDNAGSLEAMRAQLPALLRALGRG